MIGEQAPTEPVNALGAALKDQRSRVEKLERLLSSSRTQHFQFRGRRTSSISVPDGTYTALTYNTEDADPLSMCDGTTATIPTGGDGWWSLFAVFVFSSSALGSIQVQRIVSSRYGNIEFNDYAATGDVLYRLASLWCVAGDTFSLQLFQNSGSTVTCTSGHWQMAQLSA